MTTWIWDGIHSNGEIISQILGRFFNIDPLAEKYYCNSPYAFSENEVVAHVELEGLEAYYRVQGDDYIYGGSDHFRHTPPPDAQYFSEPPTLAEYENTFGGRIANSLVNDLAPIGEDINTVISGLNPDGSEASGFERFQAAARTYILFAPSGKGGKSGGGKGGPSITSRGARREVMRQEGIPTSQQPKSQSKNGSGREYTYEVPKKGGGTQKKSVQQQTKDRNHNQPHWEAGKVKTDESGNTRTNNYGRPKLTNDKSKVNYD